LQVVDALQSGEQTLGGIFACGIWNIFACSSTTRGAMNKWRPQPDSARQIGLETPWVASPIRHENHFAIHSLGTLHTWKKRIRPKLISFAVKETSNLVV
jgi:hypothetical protein